MFIYASKPVPLQSSKNVFDDDARDVTPEACDSVKVRRTLNFFMIILKACSNEAIMLVQHHPTLLDATCWPRLNTVLEDVGLIETCLKFRPTSCNIVGPTLLGFYITVREMPCMGRSYCPVRIWFSLWAIVCMHSNKGSNKVVKLMASFEQALKYIRCVVDKLY